MKVLKIVSAIVLVLVAGFVGMLYSAGVFSDDPYYTTDNGALDGYDPVAYHTGGVAQRGSAAHELSWDGATWRFDSAANRALFAAEPARYAPAFGGFCAFAVGNGYRAHSDPSVFRIVNGRLFLNYDAAAQSAWLSDQGPLIAAGDANWQDLR